MEVTRSTVQKAVVVLAKQPVFGPIRDKLGVVTRAYFAQGDLTDTQILQDFLGTLEMGLRQGLGQSLKDASMAGGDPLDEQQSPSAAASTIAPPEEDSDSTMSMGTSLRQLIYQWRFKTLQLLKLLLLQRRIMFFGYPIERLCTYQYSLISLLPGLLVQLEDCASPELKSSQAKRTKVDSVRTSDKGSLLRYMGYPLPIFGEGAFFQPYLPLQQIDSLKAASWLVGTSNGVFRSQRDCAIDVVVDLEHGGLDFLESTAALKLQNVVALTPEDRKWMDEIVNTVVTTWDPENPGRPTTLEFKGSDDYIRMKFQSYISSMLSAIKASDDPRASFDDPQTIAAFGADFVAQFKLTQAYSCWNAWTDDALYNVVPPKHPCEGRTSVVEDVGLRVTAGLYDLRLDERTAQTRETIGKGITAGSAALSAGSANLYRFASNARNDFGKQLAAYQQQRAGNSSANGDGARSPDGNAAQANGGAANAGFALPPNLQKNASEAAQAASVAAANAATQARAALGSFGSFLSSKREQWAASSRTGSPAPSTPNAPPPIPPRSGAGSAAGEVSGFNISK